MSTAHKNAMRGLTVFITDIRNSSSKEIEEQKVMKEMAKIRKKFKEGEVEGYDRRKYICKLLYMFLLGYDIDFGYMEALNLMASLKFQEKMVGYLGLALLLHENHSMLPLIIQSLQNDLQSRNEYHNALALSAVGNIGGKEMAESVAPIVQKMLISKASKPSIKKKAALCLLRLFRKYPELLTADIWAERIMQLLEEHDLGLLTSVMSLLLGVAAENPKGYEIAVKKVIWLLNKILINRDYTKDYVYYNMANPWLQVKLLRFLSLYPPCEDKESRNRLTEIMKKILASADVAKGQTVNHKNALNAVLFEAINLAIHLDDDRELVRQSGNLLVRFISAKETNVRYLALEGMSRFAALDAESSALVKKHQETVITALRDPDISIRKRALDLLYGLCDKNNSKAIVSELLSYLSTADFAIREELVIKIAILAEKFAAHYSWYVDVILQLISLAGDYVSDQIWFRVVHIVTNHEDIQEYAARTVLEALKQSNWHETTVKVGGYILGEFGHLIAEQAGCGPRAQFDVLHSKFPTCSLNTKALLLSTYIKFLNPYPELADTVRQVFKHHADSIDTELQQRACEYLKLSHAAESLLQTVWDVMPSFPEKKDQMGSGMNESVIDTSYDSLPSNQSANTSSIIDNILDLSTGPPSTHGTSDSLNDLKDLFPVTGSGNNSMTSIPSSSVIDPFASSSSTPVSTVDHMATEWYKKAILNYEGVLYEDQYIRVGFKSEFSKGFGRLMLYYINQTDSQLTGFKTQPNPVQGVTIELQPVGSVVEPRSQLQQGVRVACQSPFDDPPSLQISFNAGGKNVSFNIHLPIPIARFIEPLDLNGPEFFQYWKQVPAGPPQEAQSVIKANNPIDMDAVRKMLSFGFRLAVLKGVDPNMNNAVGAGTFHSSSGQMVCLIRIETNPAAMMYRVTTRSFNGAVTSAFTAQLAMYLKGL